MLVTSLCRVTEGNSRHTTSTAHIMQLNIDFHARQHVIKTVKATCRNTKSLLWAAPRTLVFSDKILWPWVREFISNEGVKKRYPLKTLLLALMVWKRLQIGTDLLRIITSTNDGLFRFVNIDDLERPWTYKKWVLMDFFTIFDWSAHFNSELRRNGWG